MATGNRNILNLLVFNYQSIYTSIRLYAWICIPVSIKQAVILSTNDTFHKSIPIYVRLNSKDFLQCYLPRTHTYETGQE